MSQNPSDIGVSAEQRQVLTQRSNTKGLLHLGGHLGLLAITAWLVARCMDSSLLLFAMWLHGVVLVFLFSPLHETIHITAFKTRWLNDVVAWICGLILILPPRFFRAFHLEHHRYTQDIDRDPELATPKPNTLPGYLWHVSGLPFWWDRVRTLTRHALGLVTESYIKDNASSQIISEARFFLTMYGLLIITSLTTGIYWIVWYWFIPVLIGQPMLRLFLLAEHTGCLYIPNMLRNSRTTRSNGLVRFLSWNMPYHSEHHAIAAVPFYALPSLHRLIKDRIQFQAPGYWNVHKGLVTDLRK